MTFSSLADELGNAFDSPEYDQGGTVSKSLAAEFGLSLGDSFGSGSHDLDDLGGLGCQSLGDELQGATGFGRPISPSRLSGRSSSRGSIGSPSRLQDFDATFDDEMDDSFEHSGGDILGPHEAAPLFKRPSTSELYTPLKPSAIRNQSSTRSFRRFQEEQDPLVFLSESLASNLRFLTSLKHVDEPQHEFLPSHDTKDYQPVDVQLQIHLGKLSESERVRDEQLRELGILGRELGAVNWGEGYDLEPPSLKGLDALDEEEDDEGAIGWIGEAYHHTEEPMERVVDTLGEHYEEQEDINPIDALLSDALGPPTVFPSFRTDSNRANKPNTHLPLLPQQTKDLLSTSSSLYTTLNQLSDTLHNASSLSTWLSRQIRGLRAGVEGFAEREAMEENAFKVAEGWERTKVEEGLKGQKMKHSLRNECEEFEAKLDSWKAEMGKIRGREISVP